MNNANCFKRVWSFLIRPRSSLYELNMRLVQSLTRQVNISNKRIVKLGYFVIKTLINMHTELTTEDLTGEHWKSAFYSTKVSGNPGSQSNGTGSFRKLIAKILVNLSRLSSGAFPVDVPKILVWISKIFLGRMEENFLNDYTRAVNGNALYFAWNFSDLEVWIAD